MVTSKTRPSRSSVSVMLSPIAWLRRTVSRSAVVETVWPSAARITSPGWTPASSAPYPDCTYSMSTAMAPSVVSTVETMMPSVGQP